MKNLALVIEEEANEFQLALNLAVSQICEDVTLDPKTYLDSAKVELGGE